MPAIENLKRPERKDLTIFYVLDTSGSMEGAKISTLNHAMEETIVALKDIAKSNADARLKIAVLEFNSNCNWITNNGPEDLEEDFEYEYLKAGGLTAVGSALTELNNKLSRRAYLKSMAGAFMPIVIFMTDGFATDDYGNALSEIRNNFWFAKGTKIGFALGDDADTAMVSSVVGNSEAVIKTNDLDTFKRLIKFVSVTSSMLVSSSKLTTAEGNGAAVVKQALAGGDAADASVVKLNDDEYNKEENTDNEKGSDKDDWDAAEW